MKARTIALGVIAVAGIVVAARLFIGGDEPVRGVGALSEVTPAIGESANDTQSDEPARRTSVAFPDADGLWLKTLDEDYRPIAGVSVFVPSMQVEAVGVTGDDGAVELPVRSRSDLVPVYCEKTDYLTEVLQARGDMRSLTAVLRRGETAAGRVVDRGGRPIEGATVAIVPASTPESLRPALQRVAVSHADGRFTVPALPAAERLRLEAYADGYARAYLDLPSVEHARALAITLEVGRSIEVAVVRESGDAVADAEVDTTLMLDGVLEPPRMPMLVTGADGTCRVDDIPPSVTAVEFEVRAPGYFPARRQLYGDLLLSERTVITVSDPTAALSGVLIDHHGRPIPGHVTAFYWVESVGGYPDYTTALADAHGRFTFPDLHPDQPTRLTVTWVDEAGTRAGPVYIAEDRTIAAGEHVRAEIHLTSLVDLELSCRGSDGHAASELDVHVLPADQADASTRSADDFRASGRTDASGSLRLPLPPGRYLARASRQERPLGEVEFVAAGARCEVSLSVDDDTAIHGVVREPSGDAIRNRRVVLSDAAGRRLGETVSDDEGRFRFQGGIPSSGWLFVEGPVGEWNGLMAPYSQLGAPLELTVGVGRVRGILRDALDRTPIAGSVTLRKPNQHGMVGQQGWTVTVGADGTFRCPALSAGEWRVVPQAPGYLGDELSMTVAAERETPLDLELQPGAYLAVDGMTALAGQDLSVTLRDDEGRLLRDYQWLAAGARTPAYGPLAAGRFTLEVRASNVLRTRSVQLMPAQRTIVDWTDGAWSEP